jgi:tetraacyldisaccharide 4'-kinase
VTAGRVADVAEAVWAGRTTAARAAGAAMVPLAWVYGAAVAARNALYDRGVLGAVRVDARVVSVGNVTVGGSGKTPTTIWLVEALRRRGRRVAVVARGYGKRRVGVVVVGEGGRPVVGPEEGGDEAVLVAARTRVPVVTGEARAAAAAYARTRFGADTLVLDDGFQHRALARDADLVLVPAAGLGRRLLPAGDLREPAAALRRARAVLALGDETAVPPLPRVPPGVEAFAGRVVPARVVVAAGEDLVDDDLATLPRRDVVAVAGVARPERFFGLLDRLGVGVVERVRYADHHAYDAADVARLRELRRGGARPIVTTEKDLVKLSRLPGAAALEPRALRIAVEVAGGDALVDVLLAGPQVAFPGD